MGGAFYEASCVLLATNDWNIESVKIEMAE